MMPRRQWRALLLAVLCLVLASETAFAYYVPLSLRERVLASDLIVLVRITSKHWEPHAPQAIDERQAVADVRTILSGHPEGRTIRINFGDDFICSGNYFAVGETWLVFLKRLRPGVYRTVDYAGSQRPPSQHNLNVVRRALKSHDYSGELLPPEYGSTVPDLITK